MRPSGRKPNELRNITLQTNVNKHAEGSCLTKFGDTHVLCTATVEKRLPGWLKDMGHGWITAEYGMLPRATDQRTAREASRGKQGGRTHEIQRLIGRSLRAATKLELLTDIQIKVDCDVLQADGGTRTASITGGFVALFEACKTLCESGEIPEMPFRRFVAAISCGLCNGLAVIDLDYIEDSKAQADANFVMTDEKEIIEVQATAEGEPFAQDKLLDMISLAENGIQELTKIQKNILNFKQNAL